MIFGQFNIARKLVCDVSPVILTGEITSRQQSAVKAYRVRILIWQMAKPKRSVAAY